MTSPADADGEELRASSGRIEGPSRRQVLALSAGILAAAGWSGRASARGALAGDASAAITVRARPLLAFFPRNPDQTRFGQLAFRGGLELRCDEPSFGGFSGLWRSEDGTRLVAIGDNAHWFTARVQRQAGGRISGLADTELAPMLNASGRPLHRTRSYDTESLSIVNGIAHVGVERSHEVLRFDWARRGVAARGQPVRLAADVKDLPRNRGLEAIGIAPPSSPVAGAIVAISERSGTSEAPTRGWIIGGPRSGSFMYRRQDEYDVTDLAFLPNGDLLVLERWYRPWRGVGMRIRRVAAQRLAPGALIEGEVLIDSDLASEIDNMEGLAIHQEGGKTILTLISDDNFSRMQRTILLEFELLA